MLYIFYYRGVIDNVNNGANAKYYLYIGAMYRTISSLDFGKECTPFLIYVYNDGDIGGTGHSYPISVVCGVHFLGLCYDLS